MTPLISGCDIINKISSCQKVTSKPMRTGKRYSSKKCLKSTYSGPSF